MCLDLCHNSYLLSDPAEPSRSGLKDQQKFAVCHVRRERGRENIRSTAKRNLRQCICHIRREGEGGREEEGEREREGSKPASGRIQGQQNRADHLQDLARRGAGGRRWPPAPRRASGATRREGGGREGATVSWPRRRAAPVGTVASRPLLLREGRREKRGE